jgi:hypothetical protein
MPNTWKLSNYANAPLLRERRLRGQGVLQIGRLKMQLASGNMQVSSKQGRWNLTSAEEN